MELHWLTLTWEKLLHEDSKRVKIKKQNNCKEKAQENLKLILLMFKMTYILENLVCTDILYVIQTYITYYVHLLRSAWNAETCKTWRALKSNSGTLNPSLWGKWVWVNLRPCTNRNIQEGSPQSRGHSVLGRCLKSHQISPKLFPVSK